LGVSRVIISVQSDTWKFRETLNDFQRTQLPFASVLAVNTTARLAQSALTRDLPSIFSVKRGITPFTRHAIGMTGARKSSPAASVFVKRKQAGYLGIEETGGEVDREPGHPILTPVDAKLNVYGNIPKGVLARWRSDPRRYFIGEIRGVYGAWERIGGARRGLKLLVAFRERAAYRPRFGFQNRIAASVRASFLPALLAGMARAMATAIHK
jgi:hypothetical protein